VGIADMLELAEGHFAWEDQHRIVPHKVPDAMVSLPRHSTSDSMVHGVAHCWRCMDIFAERCNLWDKMGDDLDIRDAVVYCGNVVEVGMGR
jgi:hypothetical protein